MIQFTEVDWSTASKLTLQVGIFTAGFAIQGCLLRRLMLIRLRRTISVLRSVLLLCLWAVNCFWLPYRIMDYLVLEKPLLQFNLGSFFVMWMFKSFEMIVGTFPRGANASYASWALYCGCPVQPEDAKLEKGERVQACTPVFIRRDSVDFAGHECELRQPGIKLVEGKFQAAPSGAAKTHLLSSIFYLLVLQVSLNVLVPFNMRPFDRTSILGRCVNTFLLTLCLWSYMQHTFELAASGLALLGYKSVDAFRNPMFACTSPNDFWGHRWNLTVHSILKRNFFKPLLILGFPRWFATLFAFAVSALFHEYMWSMMCYRRGFAFGQVSVFFLYQTVLCLGQTAFERSFHSVQPPRFLRWLLTLALILPSGHLFLDAIEENLRDFASIYPVIIWR
eukprot:TRINITY_DN88306_c0_g1_i2.p1 TRINITY_DN88306_c0_g1~~TRINITY_DN88306_c0_g1_i2.p1  ORF type:complete len:392 (-),score=37.65 TRINITY_DN88306_c0_g1_i2:27-1202(-)